MKKHVMSSLEIFAQTMQCVAPLPYQHAYIQQLMDLRKTQELYEV